jgi:DNA-binding PadR family transcriptional regulator
MSKNFWGFGGAYPWAGIAFGRGHGARFFENGEMRLVILSLLADGPKHGYQLMKEMQERSGGAYRASAGSVYPTLQQLEDEGMVEAEMQSGRRVYRLTKLGREEVESEPESIRRIWERAGRCEDWGQFMGPESFAVWPAVGSLVKAGLRAAASGKSEQVRDIFDRARREVENL